MESVHDGWSTFSEPHNEQVAAHRFNPALKIRFTDKTGKHSHTLDAGHGDMIHVFRSGPYTYVLNYNSGLDYVGLGVFAGDRKIGDIFLGNDWDMQEVLGPKGLSLEPINIAKRLAGRIE